MDQIAAVRAFNRFYTAHVGALDARFLGTDANLAEAGLLFEVAAHEPIRASEIQTLLGLDRGYLSRLIARCERRGWLLRSGVAGDARARPIRLTAAGRAVFAAIDERQRAAVATDLDRLDPVERADLAAALTRARLLLHPAAASGFTIRTFASGDAPFVVARQARLYAASHDWGRPLEALEADTVAAFLRDFTPGRDQCWIAEIDGVMAGAVFVTDGGGGTAKLRLLHVEPFARRRGIGDALVAGCVAFARAAGYDRLELWTHTVLAPARRIYARHGFVIVDTAVHHLFGAPIAGETWRLDLAGKGASAS